MLADPQTTTAAAADKAVADKAVADADRAVRAAEEAREELIFWNATLADYRQAKREMEKFEGVDTEDGISDAHLQTIGDLNDARFDLFDAKPPHWMAVWHKVEALVDLYCWESDDEDQNAFRAAAAELQLLCKEAGEAPFPEVPAPVAYAMSDLVYRFASAAGHHLYPQYAINRDAMADLHACITCIQDTSANARRPWAPSPAPKPDRKAAAWAEVVVRNEAAGDAYEDACASEIAAAAAAKAEVPDLGAHAWLHHQGEPVHILREEDLTRSSGYLSYLPGEEAESLKHEVRAYWDARKKADARHNVAARHWATIQTLRQCAEAEEALLQCPAPNLEAVKTKLALLIKNKSGCDVNEPEDCVDLLGVDDTSDSGAETVALATVYRDVCALNGDVWPPEGVEGFNGRAWLESYLEPGKVELIYGAVSFTDDAEPELRARYHNLAEWQKACVRAAARVMPRHDRIDRAVEIYGGGASWMGLYETLKVCQDRWELRSDESDILRLRLIDAGYSDPLAEEAPAAPELMAAE